MYFSIISYGFLLFFICFLIHIIIWQLYHPKRQILTLFIIFFLFPILFNLPIYIFYTLFNVQNVITKNTFSLNIGELLQVYLLHYAFSLAYIFTYPAAQAGCPSFFILLIIKSSMPRGITKDEIYSLFLNKELFRTRIQDLIDENLVVEKNGWLEPTKKGCSLLKVFTFLRRMFGLPIGQG